VLTRRCGTRARRLRSERSSAVTLPRIPRLRILCSLRILSCGRIVCKLTAELAWRLRGSGLYKRLAEADQHVDVLVEEPALGDVECAGKDLTANLGERQRSAFDAAKFALP